MNSTQFHQITGCYRRLSIAVLGDFCLDRYLEIDPALAETSLETGLSVFNVVRVRAQPGGAGTVLNNLAALGIGRIIPVGFAGDDGEGFELIARCRECRAYGWTASCGHRSAARLPIASRSSSSPASRRGNSIAWTARTGRPRRRRSNGNSLPRSARRPGRSMPW